MAGEGKTTATFFSKNPLKCPVCGHKFKKEELMTGRGRLIAGNLDDELMRHYEPSAKYGLLIPLLYPIATCDRCLYSAFNFDYANTPPKTTTDLLKEQTGERKEKLKPLLGLFDFTEKRRLVEGIASYILAVMCYEAFSKNESPTIKQGICALRAAWLLTDLNEKKPGENYDYFARVFYRKAAFFYNQAIENESNGSEIMTHMANLGPDIDKNYGTDGVFYLGALLVYKYGSKKNQTARLKALEKSKIIISRLVGMGKSSKNKPMELLNRGRDAYEAISDEIKKHEEQTTD